MPCASFDVPETFWDAPGTFWEVLALIVYRAAILARARATDDPYVC